MHLVKDLSKKFSNKNFRRLFAGSSFRASGEKRNRPLLVAGAIVCKGTIPV